MDYKNLKAIINHNNILLGVIITSNYNDFKNFIQFFFLIKIKKGNMYFIDNEGDKISIKSENDFNTFFLSENERGQKEFIKIYIDNSNYDLNNNYSDFIDDPDFEKFALFENKYSEEDNLCFNNNIFESVILCNDIYQSINLNIIILFLIEKEKIIKFIKLIQKCFKKQIFRKIKNLKENNNNNKNKNIYCKVCHISPIIVIIYKCKICENYNLCSKCYEKNINFTFHNHQFDIIRETYEQMLKYNFSYLILTNNLKFIFKKKRLKDDIYINVIFMKNNSKYEYLGNKETKFRIDKLKSTILCESIFLPSLKPDENYNLNIHFFNMKTVEIGKYECYLNFIVNNEIFGDPLVLNIEITK